MKTQDILLFVAAAGAGYVLGKKKDSKVSGTKEVNANVFPYIVDSISSDGYGVNPTTEKEKLQFLFDTFKSEYGWAISRYGIYRAFAEWCQGLPSSFNIDYENSEILKLAKKWGSLSSNPTERQEDKILDNWFNFISNKTFQLFRKHNISIY